MFIFILNRVFILLHITFFPCVPNKDLIYLQVEQKEVSKINRANRTDYRLKVDDNIIFIELFIQLASILYFYAILV